MTRMEEYQALLEELDRTPPALETTVERARKRKAKRNIRYITRSLTGIAACFALFVLLVNFCAPVAYACSRVPVLKELAAAVTFSRSLTDAVENEYVQPMDLTQTSGDITAQIAYLIVDQKQVNVFYRLDSEVYTELAADPDVQSANGEDLSFSVVSSGWGEENGELRSISIDFVDDNVPDSLKLTLRVYAGDFGTSSAPEENVEDAMLSDDVCGDPGYLAELDFLLEFDPEFTAAGKIFPVNQTVILDGQAITITDIEVYPTHMRIEVAESGENTAWLKNLDFYIETDWGMKFEPVSSGITATGSADSPSMISYRADSTYFYNADRLKLVITGAKWLNKDMETTYLNLVTGESGPLPEGAEFVSAERRENGWIVTFNAKYDEGAPMYQLFGHTFFDSAGTEYQITSWSNMLGEVDADGNITYFLDRFSLKDYPYEEVWLSPDYSHDWKAQNQIIVNIQ